MRLRNKPWVGAYLLQHQQYLITCDPTQTNFDPLTIFANNHPLILEIGAGKGQFITQHALRNPQFNFIGMEKESTVVGVALKRSLQTFATANKVMHNLKYFNDFAEDLSDFFPPNSISKIYLNFSDPWPKAKHAYKRLTHARFLNMYAQIIKPDGILEFKTDNDALFVFSMEQLHHHPAWTIIFATTNLYADPKHLCDNIPTEYETKFHLSGKNINKIIIQCKK